MSFWKYNKFKEFLKKKISQIIFQHSRECTAYFYHLFHSIFQILKLFSGKSKIQIIPHVPGN